MVVKPGAEAAPATSTVPTVSPASPAASSAKVTFRTCISRPYGPLATRTTEVRRRRASAAGEPERSRRCVELSPRALLERQSAEMQGFVAQRGDGPALLGAEPG